MGKITETTEEMRKRHDRMLLERMAKKFKYTKEQMEKVEQYRRDNEKSKEEN